jgi:hypothetical protein
VFLLDMFRSGTLRVGQWNRVVMGLKMNSFDAAKKPNADGTAMLSINGKTGYVNQIRWSRAPNLTISALGMGAFFGGPRGWEAVVDCTAYYKNFQAGTWVF